MTQWDWTRYLALAGVGAVVLWVAGMMMIDSVRPEGTPTAQEMLTFYQEESIVGMGAYAWMLGSVLFLLFVVALWSRLRDAAGDAGGLTMLVLIAGSIAGIGQLVTFGTDLEAHLDAENISASTAEAYYYLGDYWFTAAMLSAAPMLAATGLIVVKTGTLPHWLGWAAMVMAVPLLLPPVGWVVMFTAFPLWILVTAVLLAKSGAEVRVPAGVEA